jgi:hypothetical protein
MNKHLNIFLILIILPLSICLKFRQSADTKAPGQAGRSIASIRADEDIIILPYHSEPNYFARIHEDHKQELEASRRYVQSWAIQEEFARNHGVERNPIYATSSPQERMTFFQRNYLRFIARDFEKNSAENLSQWYNSWTVDDEVNSIDQNRERKGYFFSDGTDGKEVDSSFHVQKKQEVSVKIKPIHEGDKKNQENDLVKKKKNKDDYKVSFGFQPRIEQGAMIFTLNQYLFDTTAYFAYNNSHEINFVRKIKPLDSRVMVNYFHANKRTLYAVERKLSEHWVARYSFDARQNVPAGQKPNETIAVSFNIGF